MPAPSPLAPFLDPLERLGFPYCITGSVAASVYGEPGLIHLASQTAVDRAFVEVQVARLGLGEQWRAAAGSAR